MAYKKQNFIDGQVLGAEQLNNMEDGISNATELAEKSVSFKYQNLTDTQKAQTRANIGAIGESDIESATNAALAKAKASGEFDGRDGIDGKDGSDGVAGRDGVDGKDGIDGVSVTHTWNGTTLIVTSKSGTSSADLKGETGAAGADGNDGVSVTHSWNGTTLNVTSASGTTSTDLKGEDGKPGADGHTPVKGTDYFTEADKAEMVSAVIANLTTEVWTFTVDNGDGTTSSLTKTVVLG